MAADLALAVVLTLVASCGAAASAPGPLPSDVERVTLAAGQATAVRGGRLELRFDDVVSDSRCPSTEQCVWAGQAEIAITVTADGEQHGYRVFAPGASPNAVVHSGMTMQLVSLDPYPKKSGGIPKDRYRATFEIADSQPGD